jgi:hypothetical protein
LGGHLKVGLQNVGRGDWQKEGGRKKGEMGTTNFTKDTDGEGGDGIWDLRFFWGDDRLKP